MTFETLDIPISDLKRNTGQIPGVPKNPRVIRDNNFKKLKDSITQDPEMLQLREIIAYRHADQYIIIGGNMRFEAMKALQFKTAKCKVITGDVDAEQLKRIILKDNSAYGEWDFDALANEWEQTLITACAIDIPVLEEAKLEEEAEEDDFNVDEAMPTKEPITKKGDIWQLGKHRLLCGDCTDLAAISDFMQGRYADLVVTDPPYNVDYEQKSRAIEKYKGQKTKTRTDEQNKIENDKMTDAQFAEFCRNFYATIADVVKPGGAVYVWHSMQEMLNLRNAAPKCLAWHDTLIWKKNHFCLTRKDYQLMYEPCLYFTKEGRAHYFCPKRNLADVIDLAEKTDIEKATKDELKALLTAILELPTTVVDCERPMKSKEHPTMKPVKLFGEQIKNSSRIGEIVFDPFGGSGTTLIAAEQLHRTAYLVELSPTYCDVIVKRWEALTGEKATRIPTPNQEENASKDNERIEP